MSENRVIGRDNGLPWRLPADMKRFKTLTTGHTMIMGRKTFDSVGKPLPLRRTIVITRDRTWRCEGVEIAHTLEEALERAADQPEVFVVGGADVYRQALPVADRIHLTVVHTVVAGDAWFPEFSAGEWKLVSDETHPADERHAFSFSFRVYDRIARRS